MINYIAVSQNGNVEEFKADNDIAAKDYMHRRFGLFWHHHYKLYKGNEVE
jgi:hypothetical protein